MSAPFQIGDRVKKSEYSLRAARDSWLKAGSQSLKSAYRDAYEREMAIRGTVLSCASGVNGFYNSVQVKTDSQSIHSSMPCIWEVCK
jgi:hypothetical protein